MNPLHIPAPSLEHVARVHVDLEPPRSLGPGPWGERRLVPIVGGHFEGPRLRGRVLAGGADWQVVHANGTITVDTRYALETHDGALIYIATRGVRTGPPETLARLARGESVDATEYYFRVVATFETGASGYSWLNESVFVASAVRHVNAVVYNLYRLS
jgi:hypothetical protein